MCGSVGYEKGKKKVYKDNEKLRGLGDENRKRSIKGCELSGVWPEIRAQD
jgi:hypothetical protein